MIQLQILAEIKNNEIFNYWSKLELPNQYLTLMLKKVSMFKSIKQGVSMNLYKEMKNNDHFHKLLIINNQQKRAESTLNT